VKKSNLPSFSSQSSTLGATVRDGNLYGASGSQRPAEADKKHLHPPGRDLIISSTTLDSNLGLRFIFWLNTSSGEVKCPSFTQPTSLNADLMETDVRMLALIKQLWKRGSSNIHRAGMAAGSLFSFRTCKLPGQKCKMMKDPLNPQLPSAEGKAVYHIPVFQPSATDNLLYPTTSHHNDKEVSELSECCHHGENVYKALTSFCYK